METLLEVTSPDDPHGGRAPHEAELSWSACSERLESVTESLVPLPAITTLGLWAVRSRLPASALAGNPCLLLCEARLLGALRL